ncbi:BTAD domain-containing putative transcriptional regulator [Saccharothrix sp.]|uniref:BTAD domain-containing putative transcriptional regulator n=1 Tax=Saccharothrix sp. TaxID=1873460 RepID=UPI0028113034|nr:BTAD domain-containing putative transcriptional regulator [Saccharothrix sp.]
MLLDVLTAATWLAWVLFALDVTRCATTIARGRRLPDLSAVGPVYRIAAVLVGTLLIPISEHVIEQEVPAVAASSNTWGRPTAASHEEWPRAEEEAPRAKSAVVQPYDPETDVYDSLWRMAERTLGNGNRWPEIFELNKGKPQPNGDTLTQPSLIFPGEEMILPADATTATTPDPQPSPPAPTPTAPAVPATTPAPTTTPPTSAPTTASTAPSGEPGFRWGEELFVGLGLASAVSTALVVVRRRNRRRYRPGSRDRSDLPVAPVVYQLRLAHLRTSRDDRDFDEPDVASRPPLVVPGSDGSCDEPGVVPAGVRDGREIAVDLAALHGLGLIGAGASAAIRALVVTALASTSNAEGARVVVPAEDVEQLFGRQVARSSLPASVCVVSDLDTALDVLETETLVRASRLPLDDRHGPVVLVARVPGPQSRRLQAVLDNGAGVGVVGLLLGQWSPGVTAYVREDGTVSATSPGPGEPLRGTSMFRLGDHHAREILDLLLLAHSNEPDEASAADAELELLDGEDDRPAADTSAVSPPPDVTKPPVGQPPASSEAAPAPLRITVLGPPRVWWRPGAIDEQREVTSAFQPRVRELVVFLALHLEGVNRDALTSALWPNSRPDKTTNALNSTMSRLRRCVAAATEGSVPDIILVGEGRFRLNTALVEVDYYRFTTAVARRRTATTDRQRAEAYRDIVDSYTGPLADGLDAEWIETPREAVRRDAIDAVAALARTLIDQDPQRTLDLLEVARSFDPHNELIYRDIMRLQERLGQLDAIPRTLDLLTARLAEIDERPTEHAFSLAARLRARSDTEQVTQPAGD